MGYPFNDIKLPLTAVALASILIVKYMKYQLSFCIYVERQ